MQPEPFDRGARRSPLRDKRQSRGAYVTSYRERGMLENWPVDPRRSLPTLRCAAGHLWISVIKNTLEFSLALICTMFTPDMQS